MSADGGEMPLIVYRRRKENPHLWEGHMNNWGLTEKEKNILKKHMNNSYGMCITQEQLMAMVQDPEISGFTFLEADGARKIIAKKKMAEVEKLHQKFLDAGKQCGNREEFLKYIWQESFAVQMGYSLNEGATI